MPGKSIAEESKEISMSLNVNITDCLFRIEFKNCCTNFTVYKSLQTYTVSETVVAEDETGDVQ